jgi:hypothetical protein
VLTLSHAIERGILLAGVLRAQAADVREAGKRRLLEAGGRKEIAMMVTKARLSLRWPSWSPGRHRRTVKESSASMQPCVVDDVRLDEAGHRDDRRVYRPPIADQRPDDSGLPSTLAGVVILEH